MIKNLLLLFLLLTTWSITAQEVVSMQGNSYTNASISIDFTIGEAVIKTVTDGNNTLTQGFHQIYFPLFSTLPIELLRFTAVAKDTYVQIDWLTATEINNDYFNVERSADGLNFNSMSKINGAGNSTEVLSYSSVDERPLDGISYYRLKQTDYDGETSYSNIEAVAFNKRNNSVEKFSEKPSRDASWINGGFFILSNKMLDFLQKDENFEKDVLPRIVKRKGLSFYKHGGYWQCMDTPRDKDKLEKDIKNGKIKF